MPFTMRATSSVLLFLISSIGHATPRIETQPTGLVQVLAKSVGQAQGNHYIDCLRKIIGPKGHLDAASSACVRSVLRHASPEQHRAILSATRSAFEPVLRNQELLWRDALNSLASGGVATSNERTEFEKNLAGYPPVGRSWVEYNRNFVARVAAGQRVNDGDKNSVMTAPKINRALKAVQDSEQRLDQLLTF